MFLEVRNKFINKPLGRRFRCHGCWALSKLMKSGKMPKGWAARFEGAYSFDGRRRFGFGQVENHYCPACVRAGCSAATVARGEVRRIAVLREVNNRGA